MSKKEKENYYKIDNEEALRADPRMWAAGNTFFTPWDIARLNHLYEMGKKNYGIEEVDDDDHKNDSCKKKLKYKLYNFLNLEVPSSEEDAINEIKTPPYSSGLSENEDDAEK